MASIEKSVKDGKTTRARVDALFKKLGYRQHPAGNAWPGGNDRSCVHQILRPSDRLAVDNNIFPRSAVVRCGMRKVPGNLQQHGIRNRAFKPRPGTPPRNSAGPFDVTGLL